MSIKLDRRKLMATMGSALALGYLSKRQLWDTIIPKSFKGNVTGANFKRGHHLLTKTLPRSKKVTEDLDVAIIGAGVSGITCAWKLSQENTFSRERVKLYDLEDHFGGKSHAVKEKKTQAPWGAHYLPLPNIGNTELLDLLRKLKILGPQFSANHMEEGYDPFMTIGDPREKLFIYGRLQDGLVPQSNLTKEEESEFQKFFNFTQELTHTKDDKGSYAFDIPMEHSSKNEKFLKYDRMTMSELLNDLGLKSAPLLWYVDYCCRDDYGTTVDKISAWAGLHYFCSRRPHTLNSDQERVLTWPEGNNYLVTEMMKQVKYPFLPGHLLLDIKGNHLHLYDFKNQKPVHIRAKKIVLALPQFIIAKILNQKTKYEYSPWMVANINVRWDQDIAKRFAWDNVNYKGAGLGFISAKHQSLESHPTENTLTYYWPLTHLDPKEARKWALKRTHNQWSQDIIEDLGPMIFDLKERIKSIEVWQWGHGMVSPGANFMHQGRSKTIKNKNSNIFFAHSDLSGVSLFEEAFYRGTEAAKSVISSKQV